MNTKTRVISFGIIAGLVWSLVAGVLTDLFKSPHQTLLYNSTVALLSGAISGVLVSLCLYRPLVTSNPMSRLLLGALSLPLGAFFFGAAISVVGWGSRLGNPNPLMAGLVYAALSVVSLYSVGLFPLAIGTTHCLWMFVVKGGSMTPNKIE